MSNMQSEIASKEHDGTSQPGVLEPQRIGMYGWSGTQWIRVAVTSDGRMKVNNE